MAKSVFGRFNPWSKDRNDQARLSVAQQQFASQVHAGHVSARDRFGNPVQVGSLIVWHADIDTVWEVVAVRPVLDPSKPPGFLSVEVRAAGQFHALAQNLLPSVITVGARQPVETAADPIGQAHRIADGLATPFDDPDPRD